MRHRVGHRKLGRVTEHRIAMLRNQAHALLRHERIETTVPKAKELRPFVERIITIAKRGIAGGEPNGKSLHARRLVLRDIQNRDVVAQAVRHDRAALRGAAGRLHPHPAPRLPPRRQRGGRADRAGRQRVQPERREAENAGSGRRPKPKGVGGRLRAAAERLRGKKAEAAEGEAAEEARRRRPGRRAPSAASRAAPTPAARAPRRPRRARRGIVRAADPGCQASSERKGRCALRVAGPFFLA